MGFTLAGGYAAAAGHSPKRLAVADETAAYSFADIHARSHKLASALAMFGVGARNKVALLSRNRVAMLERMLIQPG